MLLIETNLFCVYWLEQACYKNVCRSLDPRRVTTANFGSGSSFLIGDHSGNKHSCQHGRMLPEDVFSETDSISLHGVLLIPGGG